MAQIILPGKAVEREVNTTTVDTLIKSVAGLGEGAMGLLKQFLELPLSSPTMALVLGIIINDILAHQVDWIHWTHKEAYCTNCNVWVSIYDWLTGAHDQSNIAFRDVPGVISTAANIQLATVILGSFGVSAAGSIISDITQISHVLGAGSPTDSMITPTLKVLFKGGGKSAIASLADLES